MLGEIEACVKRMVDVGIADAHDVDVWRQVFEQSSVSKRHVDSGTVYLALAPEDKRKDCFRNLGFSPNIGLFSEWALDNGLDPLARHMSWRLNSQCQYRFGDGEFFVMSPGVVENFQCEHPCKYVDLEMRVGPEAAVGLLTMYEDLVNPKRADSVCEVMELDNDVDPVVLPDEPMLETSYLLALRPDVRHEAFQQLGLGISLLQLVSAEFPFQDVQALEQLRCDVVEDFPDLLCAGDDVLISIAEETRFTLHRHGGTGMSMHSVIQTLCAWDQYARYIRERYDDVDYGLRYDGRIYMETCHYDMRVAEPLYDTEVDPGIPVAVSFGDGNGEHYCSLHGYVDVVPFGLRESFRALLGTESSFSAMVQLVGGRFVDWTCLCEDRCYHDFRSVVFVRYKGSGVDRVVDAVWYGLERTGKVPMFVWVKRVVLDFNAPGLGVIGLSSCKRVGLDSLPSIVARDKTVTGGVSFVKFQYDSNRYQGDTFGWSDGYDDLENQIRGCDCGHGHTV